MNEIKLKLITPLWTGDIDSRSNLVQTTGIIGSLRWWAEAVLRGLGYFACDPSEESRCPEEVKNNNNESIAYCPVCLIFGATGIRRLFRLEVNGGERLFDGSPINIKPSGRNRGWFLGSGIVGELELKIVPLSKDFDYQLVFLPLTIAANWGAIGAKTQVGYGVVRFDNKIDLKFDECKNSLNNVLQKKRIQNIIVKDNDNTSSTFPNLQEMFFAEIQFEVNKDWWKEADGIKQALEPKNRQGEIDEELKKRNTKILGSWINSGSVPISPAIKNWLRFGDGRNLWATGSCNDNTIETWLFGTTKNQKSVSKINVSCAYRINANLWEFRIWGWIPSQGCPNGFNKNTFLDNLKQSLNNILLNILYQNTINHEPIVWREYNSSRDTVRPNEVNIENFIQSLLLNEGGSK